MAELDRVRTLPRLIRSVWGRKRNKSLVVRGATSHQSTRLRAFDDNEFSHPQKCSILLRSSSWLCRRTCPCAHRAGPLEPRAARFLRPSSAMFASTRYVRVSARGRARRRQCLDPYILPPRAARCADRKRPLILLRNSSALADCGPSCTTRTTSPRHSVVGLMMNVGLAPP